MFLPHELFEIFNLPFSFPVFGSHGSRFMIVYNKLCQLSFSLPPFEGIASSGRAELVVDFFEFSVSHGIFEAILLVPLEIGTQSLEISLLDQTHEVLSSLMPTVAKD